GLEIVERAPVAAGAGEHERQQGPAGDADGAHQNRPHSEKPPPSGPIVGVRLTFLLSATPVLSGPCENSPNTAVTATIAPTPYRTSAPIASILPRRKRESLLSINTWLLMSDWIASWFDCARCPT